MTFANYQRCAEHQQAFERWLSGNTDQAEYHPRYNGVLGLYESETRRDAHGGIARTRLTRGLRAGEELHFD